MSTSHWPARMAWALVGLTVLACVGHSMLFRAHRQGALRDQPLDQSLLLGAH